MRSSVAEVRRKGELERAFGSLRKMYFTVIDAGENIDGCSDVGTRKNAAHASPRSLLSNGTIILVPTTLWRERKIAASSTFR